MSQEKKTLYYQFAFSIIYSGKEKPPVNIHNTNHVTMKLSQLVGQRLKEAPRDAQTISHIYLIRGGYCRPVSTGLFTLLPLGYKITDKIKAIIREARKAEKTERIKLGLK